MLVTNKYTLSTVYKVVIQVLKYMYVKQIKHTLLISLPVQ